MFVSRVGSLEQTTLTMVSNISYLVFTCILVTITGSLARDKKGKHRENNQQLWKKTYENELTDAMMYSKNRGNVTRIALSPRAEDNEAVIEKIMETIASSEKYLKKVDSLDYKLNRLDIEIHDKTNDILKYLGELMKAIRVGSNFKGGAMADRLMSEMASMKEMVRSQASALEASGGSESRNGKFEEVIDSRLGHLEHTVKSVASAVEGITNTISEVKNRHHSTPLLSKTETSEPMNIISEFRRALLEQKAKKCECKSNRVERSERYPLDCYEIQAQGFNVSGIFRIRADGTEPFYVLCDLTTAGGGWTVFQNRFDGSQDFYKSWSDYKYGFGNLAGEFWLGLEKLHYLTNQKLYELRIELEAQNGQEAHASYSVLTLGPEYEGYRISTLGTYDGNAGDSLSYHAGQKFSTMDMDNDEWKDGACAVEHGGAWWYKECDKSNLNGFYVATDEHHSQTIYWISFKGPNMPLTRTKMMIRPLPAHRPIDSYIENRNLIIDTGTESEVRRMQSKGLKPKMRRPDGYRHSAHQGAQDHFFSTYT